MCLNCGYPHASAEGYCSEICQREFEEAQQEDITFIGADGKLYLFALTTTNEEATAILSELL